MVSPSRGAMSDTNREQLVFQNTQLFHVVMQVLTSMDNSTGEHANTSYDVSDIPYGEESRLAFIIIMGVLFALITTVGNLMVMVSFKIDKQLQTISNYFLFSLAVADITIGCISIPLMTYYTAMRTWGIGYTMCQFWLCIDYLMSNASVLNLLLISFDRYFSVTRPLSYRPRRTTKKALTMIACTYIISVILWPPWIISWPYIEGKFTVEPGMCVVQFLETNPYVTVGTAIAAFYLPVTIMIILYTRVYWETKKRQREFGKLQASQVPRKSMRRDTSTTSFVRSSEKSSGRKSNWPFSKKTSIEGSGKCSWIKSCAGKTNGSVSEDSSEVAAVNVDDTSMSSSLYTTKRKNTSPPCSPNPVIDVSGVNSMDFPSEIPVDGVAQNGTTNFRSRTGRTDRPSVDTYTVLIELGDGRSRPSVRLSTCESPVIDSNMIDRSMLVRNSFRSSQRTQRTDSCVPTRQTSEKESPTKNGRGFKSFSGNDRKSEKERRKNERKQESKAAKTLSAILFAFIITWTPYNVIVCWEAFFPRSIPTIFFTISYCLCYINSTINPLCYALCNARFRHTYMRILRCKLKPERPGGLNIARNAYIRRQDH